MPASVGSFAVTSGAASSSKSYLSTSSCARARSVSENGDSDTISVAMASRVRTMMCLDGSATPRSSRAAVASAMSRLVSDGRSLRNHRDVLKTPSGLSVPKKTSHASRVYRPFSDIVNAPALVDAQVSMSDICSTS